MTWCAVVCCVQMLGRGLRIAPGKTDCVVLDFTDKYNQVRSDSYVPLYALELCNPVPGFAGGS